MTAPVDAPSKLAALLLTVFVGAALVGCKAVPAQQPAQEAIEDGVLTARVKTALIEDPLTQAHHIDVETFKGQVQLSGYVETDEARSRALQLARDVEGVKRVRDALQVKREDY